MGYMIICHANITYQKIISSITYIFLNVLSIFFRKTEAVLLEQFLLPP